MCVFILSHLFHPYHLSSSFSFSIQSQRLFFVSHLCEEASIADTRYKIHRSTLSEISAMADDWDLQAVVRGCSSMSSSLTTTTTTTTSSTTLMADSKSNSSKISPFATQKLQGQVFTLNPDPSSSINLIEELNELYKPFLPKSDQLIPSLSPQSTTTTSSLSSISVSIEQRQNTKEQHKQQQQGQTKASHVPSVNNPRSKKRKNQIKRVCQVPAENISSDIWSWRKYGQKPIKGSPYPRGYYKCSSSKGCLARKQVERNRSDPTMFTVTYTADHNHSAPAHRNSLAGSTRQKIVTTQSVITEDSNKPTTKPSSSANSIEEDLVLPENTDTENKLENLLGNEEEDELGFSDMSVSDDFFVGLEGLVVPATEDYFSDQ